VRDEHDAEDLLQDFSPDSHFGLRAIYPERRLGAWAKSAWRACPSAVATTAATKAVARRTAAKGAPRLHNYDSTVATEYEHCGCKAETPRQEELSHLSYGWTLSHVTLRPSDFSGRCPSGWT
jgi:hypothetical protein